MGNKLLILIGIIVLIALGIFFAKQKNTPPNTIKNIGSFSLPYQEGLPELVEAKRQAIYKAALSENYENLKKEAGKQFTDGFGIGFDPWENEKNAEVKMFKIIPKLLRMPYVFLGNEYLWPSIFAKSPKEWNYQDENSLKDLLSDEEIKSYKENGGYSYYRMTISPEGEWTMYLNGKGD